MTHSVIYSDNDSRVVLMGLRDRAGTPIAVANVSLDSITERDGTLLTGISFPISMNHVGNGDYEGLVPSSAGLRPERAYYATVTASYSGVRGQWRETLICRKREA